MIPWFVYIVRCKDKSLYIGITPNIKARLEKHNQGLGARYTKGRLPVKLVYTEKIADKSAALRREIELKKWRKEKKEELIAHS
jgi:putative endonuclease